MSKILTTLNALCLALYGVGLTATSTFFTNTRIIGVRDSRWKSPLIIFGVVAWPLAGLVHVLVSGGPGTFLVSLARPVSWGWVWRMAITLHGARYLLQEAYRHGHPLPRPQEVTNRQARDVDMRKEIARAEGVDLQGLKGRAFMLNELYDLEVATYEVRLDRLPPEFDGFTLLQLSDIHYGDISPEFVRRYVNLGIGMEPDLIALTGDYQHFPEDTRSAMRMLTPVGEWSRKERGGLGAVAVLGNHDTWAGTAEVSDALREAGIPVLGNKHIELKRGNASLYIVGVADPWSLRADLQRALHNVPEAACKVLLAHVPDFIVDAAKRNVDLQLSGHIHGGQIKLPWVGALLSPSRYNRRYLEGWHKRGRTLMYVSRGLGGHPAVRWNCKPEIAVFVLRSRTV